MKKHAYLIMPFNNFEILKKQISLLDYPQNDIYIHMDAKIGEFDQEQFCSIPKYSNIKFIPRKNLYWADFSQVDIVFDLIKNAKEVDDYDYFHLLSGVDLPIKTQKYIHEFLKDKDEILLAIYPHTISYSDDRVKYYYNFLNYKNYRNCKFLKGVNLMLMYLQKLIGINRLRNENIKIYNGWDWCSLPNDFASYLLENEKKIYKIFRKTLCPIELVYHSMAYNSEKFRNKIRDVNNFQNSSMRLIDWKRGKPYTFRKEDFDEIIKSKCFFARKFDENIDFEIVNMIYDYIFEKQIKELSEISF